MDMAWRHLAKNNAGNLNFWLSSAMPSSFEGEPVAQFLDQDDSQSGRIVNLRGY